MPDSRPGEALVRQFYEQAINQRDPGACHRLLSSDFRHNDIKRGSAGQAEVVAAFLAGFSDLKNDVVLVLEDGPLVAAHLLWTGTHDGPFMGYAANGKRIDFASTAILRVSNGVISEAWDVIDLTLLSQLQSA